MLGVGEFLAICFLLNALTRELLGCLATHATQRALHLGFVESCLHQEHPLSQQYLAKFRDDAVGLPAAIRVLFFLLLCDLDTDRPKSRKSFLTLTFYCSQVPWHRCSKAADRNGQRNKP